METPKLHDPNFLIVNSSSILIVDESMILVKMIPFSLPSELTKDYKLTVRLTVKVNYRTLTMYGDIHVQDEDDPEEWVPYSTKIPAAEFRHVFQMLRDFVDTEERDRVRGRRELIVSAISQWNPSMEIGEIKS